MPQSPLNELLGLTPEQLIAVVASRLIAVEEDADRMAGRVDRLSSEIATRSAITELTSQVTALREATEARMRKLEDWRTGILAQMTLLAGLGGVAGALVGHFWK